MRRRDEVMSSDIQELEASLRQQEVVREQETPAEEIARLKEASQADHINMDREVRHSSQLSPLTNPQTDQERRYNDLHSRTRSVHSVC